MPNHPKVHTLKKCLKCGKTDHLTKDCPELAGAGHSSLGGFVGYVMKVTVEERDLHVYAAITSSMQRSAMDA